MSLKGYATKGWTFLDDYAFGGPVRKRAKKLASKARRQRVKRELRKEGRQ